LVSQYFGGGAIQLATLQSVFGVGMIAGGLLLGVSGGFRRRIVTVVVSLALMGVAFCTIGFLPATAFAAAVAAFGLRGIASPVCDGSLFAMLQATVPHEMQGRVLSLLLSGAKAASPLGLAMAGPVADRFGVPVWYAIAGVVMVLCSLLVFVLPGVLHIEDAPPAGSAGANPQ
jgi:DHA3 family macrolide efflux protein-like MFS transporter